jgi:hypothetical protein
MELYEHHGKTVFPVFTSDMIPTGGFVSYLTSEKDGIVRWAIESATDDIPASAIDEAKVAFAEYLAKRTV